MRFTYSPGADALAVHLADGPSARMVAIAPGIHADVDAEGRLLAVEVLEASHWYGRAALEAIGPPVEFLTLAQASRESGLEASTLRRQVLAGRIAGAVKRGRDWLVPRHALWNYLEHRSPRGRPPAKAAARRARAKQRASTPGGKPGV